jgi:serine/threonine protein kinase
MSPVAAGISWRGTDVYLHEEQMEMTKLIETSGSIVYRVRLRDQTAVIKRFKHGDSLEHDTELQIIARTHAEPGLGNLFVSAYATNRSSIVMESCEGDLSRLSWRVYSDEDIEAAVRRLCDDLKTMVAHDVYYTDLKLQNIVFARDPHDGAIVYKWADFSSVATNEWSTQTYPYPTARYNFNDYDNTFMPACEEVLVWGLGILWAQILGHERLCVEYLCFDRLTQRSLRAFKFALFKHPVPWTLRQIFDLKIHRLDDVFA